MRPVKTVTNKAFQARARHFTITKVAVDGQNAYGFCVDDTGEENIYIPAPLITKYHLTPDDEGSGFTALTRRSHVHHQSGDGKVEMVIMPPMVFDDVVAEAGGATPDELDALESELAEALDHHETLTALHGQVDALRNKLMAGRVALEKLANAANVISRDVLTTATMLDALADDLANLHNQMTEEQEWRDENYPDQADPVAVAAQ